MTRLTNLIAAAFGLSALTAGLAKQAAVPLELSEDRLLVASVNGRDARLQVRPDGVSLPILNPDAAAALALKPSLTRARTVVGRTTIRGWTDAARVRLDGPERKLRVVWFDRPLIEGSDGVVGPAALAAPVVVFKLRQPQPGETEIVLPVEDFGPSGMPTRMIVGSLRIQTFFNLETDETIVSAAAGAELARRYDGKMTGDAYDMRVDFDVQRPVRSMQFAQQPSLAGLLLAGIVVRTADSSTAAIPDAEADPNEIVITGTNLKKQPQRYRISIGRTTLAPCSRLIFDKPAKLIRLSCKLPAQANTAARLSN
jgi:hypothetical protein